MIINPSSYTSAIPVALNDDINIQTEGIILLDYKILGIETKES